MKYVVAPEHPAHLIDQLLPWNWKLSTAKLAA
jgi:hypothetical protein